MTACFDAYAAEYEAALTRALNVSGEDMHYFARGRVEWLLRRLRMLEHSPGQVMDFGCGTGASLPWLGELPGIERLIGVDPSEDSLKQARQRLGPRPVELHTPSQHSPQGLDLVFSNGVFHHIPLRDRPEALDYVRGSLAPGGLFALWENNPWNPGTRYVMSRIPFDRGALTLSAPGTRRMLRRAGFIPLSTDYLFIFPRWLGWLRQWEPHLSRWPLGTQYLVLARRP